MSDIFNTLTYDAEFIGMITKTDEYNRQVGEMYYRCKINNNGEKLMLLLKYQK